MLNELKNRHMDARKSRNVFLSGLFSSVLGDAQRLAKDTGREVEDADVEKVIRKFLKTIETNLAQFPKESDNYANAVREQDILKSFLPAQLSAEQIQEIVNTQNFANIGAGMKYFKENYAGLYDNGTLAYILKNS